MNTPTTTIKKKATRSQTIKTEIGEKPTNQDAEQSTQEIPSEKPALTSELSDNPNVDEEFKKEEVLL